MKIFHMDSRRSLSRTLTRGGDDIYRKRRWTMSIIAAVFLILLALLSGSVYPVRSLEIVYSLKNILSEGLKYGTSNGVYASTQNASTTSSVCGNGIKESGEQCDAGGSNGSCPVACSNSCATNSCGGGGGGGGSGYVAPVTSAIFNGRAYPKSTVTLLKDAQIAATTIAGTDANFQITLTGLSGGNYIFSLYSEDSKGIRSSLLTFPVSVTSGATTQISNIFIAPTIAVDKSEVKRGDNIAIFGQSVPNSEVTISVNSDEEFFNKIKADAGGAYLYNFDTSPLEIAQHFTKSKAALNGEISSFSKTISFNVGAKTTFAQPTKCPAKADLNNDCKVNLVDFSIAAYWYKRPAPPASSDLNNDRRVDLVDFSIMAFYWTG